MSDNVGLVVQVMCGTEPYPELFRAKKYKLHDKFFTKTDFQVMFCTRSTRSTHLDRLSGIIFYSKYCTVHNKFFVNTDFLGTVMYMKLHNKVFSNLDFQVKFCTLSRY